MTTKRERELQSECERLRAALEHILVVASVPASADGSVAWARLGEIAERARVALAAERSPRAGAGA